MLHDDAVDGRQSEPGTAADAFGGEERLEDSCASRVIHADAGVGDGHHRECTDRQSARVLRVHVDDLAPCLHFQAAAMRHRIASVDDQVHHDLLELTFAEFHLPGAVVQIEHERHVFAAKAAQHRLHLPDRADDVDDDRHRHLLAAEREQVLRQRGGLLAGQTNLFDRLAVRSAPRHP